jgi:ribosomal protein S18 acetylase RimI-like enzyme
MDIEFEFGGTELLDELAPLWCELNALHAEVSPHFRERFESFTFDDRKRDLLNKSAKAEMHIGMCRIRDSEAVGYCISSVEGTVGEIESVYVRSDVRGKGVGSSLVRRAMDWMRAKGAERIKVEVVVGNEASYSFYAQFGLFPRVAVLTTRDEKSPESGQDSGLL